MSFQSQLNASTLLLDLKAKPLSMSISRDGIVYRALGLIEIESIVIEDLKTRNEITGGSLQGYKFTMTINIPSQSIFTDNTFVDDREEISRGRWYVSLTEVDTKRFRVTPFPVALQCIEQDFQGTRVIFTLQTQDILWLKHRSATSPVVISPILITSNTLPVPLTESNTSSNISFQLTNPSLNPSIENFVVYDIFVYTDPSRTSLLWSVTGLTKSQVIDNPYVSSSLNSLLQRGAIYYGLVRCRIASSSADTLFRFVIELEKPSFISPTPPNNALILFTNNIVDFRVERGANSSLATTAEFETKRTSTLSTISNSINYNVLGEAQLSITFSSILQEDGYEVRARSFNSVAQSDWSVVRFITAQVFRGLPIIANFQSNRQKIATGDPTVIPYQQVVLSVDIIAKDTFAGSLRVRLLDVTSSSSPVLIQEQVWNSPAFNDTRTFIFIDNPLTTKSYQIEVINLNNQSVFSTIITINEVQLITQNLYVHFTARSGLFTDTSANTVANTSDRVARWNARVSVLPNYHLLNDVVSKQPFKRLNAGGMPFVEFTTNLSHLIQPLSQQALPDETPLTCYILALAQGYYNASSILVLKNNAVGPNTFLGLFDNLLSIRYLNTSNNEVSTFVSNNGLQNVPIVFVFSFKRDGNVGQFISGRRNLPSNTYNTLTLNNMKNNNAIGVSRLTLNGNTFRTIPDTTGPGYNYLQVYEVLLYTEEHTLAQREQMLEWIATANNL